MLPSLLGPGHHRPGMPRLPGALCPGSRGPAPFASAQGPRCLLSTHTPASLCRPPLTGWLRPLTGQVAGGIPLAAQGVRCRRHLPVSRGGWRVGVSTVGGSSGLRAPRRGAQQRVGDALKPAVKGTRRAGRTPCWGTRWPSPVQGGERAKAAPLRPGRGSRGSSLWGHWKPLAAPGLPPLPPSPCWPPPCLAQPEDAFGSLHLAGHVLSDSHPCVPRAGVG